MSAPHHRDDEAALRLWIGLIILFLTIAFALGLIAWRTLFRG